jgi:DNA-binding transcriptional regulator WhiA
MRVIPREARKITYSTEIRDLKKRLSFNDIQKSLLTGSILGDGNLEPNWSKTNYRLKISHSVKQARYVNWKYEILNNWVLTKPNIDRCNRALTFRTISHPEITKLANIFYKNKRKIIPDNLEINPLILAVWFMDDGNVIRRDGKVYGYHLNTQSFNKEENLTLMKILSKNFKINASLEINHGKYRLRFMRKEYRQNFLSAIRKLILPSMLYKVS